MRWINGSVPLIGNKFDPKPVKKIVMRGLYKNQIIYLAISYHKLSLLILNQHFRTGFHSNEIHSYQSKKV